MKAREKVVYRPSAEILWEVLGDIPIDENECIEESFLHFPPGTDRETIWHWFEDEFNIRVYDLMYEEG